MQFVHTAEMAEYNRLYKEADNIYTRYAASKGVSPTTLFILYSIYTEAAPCTQTKLVEEWGMPMQTVNSCLKTLVKNGIVRLEYMEGNRKSKCIQFCDQGRELAERIVAPLVRAENQALEALGSGQRQLLLELTKLHTGLLRDFLFEQQ